MKITISKLPPKCRPFHRIVKGPNAEFIRFTTIRKAEVYANLRKQCATQREALTEFKLRFPDAMEVKNMDASGTDSTEGQSLERRLRTLEAGMRQSATDRVNLLSEVEVLSRSRDRMRECIGDLQTRLAKIERSSIDGTKVETPKPKTPGQIAHETWDRLFNQGNSGMQCWEGAAIAVLESQKKAPDRETSKRVWPHRYELFNASNQTRAAITSWLCNGNPHSGPVGRHFIEQATVGVLIVDFELRADIDRMKSHLELE